LCRNYYQINGVDRVYAVTNLMGKKRKDLSHVNIARGTAWACQMYMNQCIETPEVYFYEKSEGIWYIIESTDVKITWNTIKEKPPRPCGHYTRIASRQLSSETIQAMKSLFD
jgi:uncharacterized membrane protein